MDMQSVNALTMSREQLEHLALLRVCACMYYELADTLDETLDSDLIRVIKYEYECETCDMTD